VNSVPSKKKNNKPFFLANIKLPIHDETLYINMNYPKTFFAGKTINTKKEFTALVFLLMYQICSQKM